MKVIQIVTLCCVVAIGTAKSRFHSDYIKWNRKMLADNNFRNDLEVIDVTNNYNQRILRFASSLTCPNYTAEYPRGSARSTSPWVYFLNFNSNRKPKFLLDSRCLCDGCIDMDSGQEDITTFKSVPITSQITVLINGETAKENVNFGCTCIWR